MTVRNDDFLLAEQIMHEEAEEAALDDAYNLGAAYRSKIMREGKEMVASLDPYCQQTFWDGFYS